MQLVPVQSINIWAVGYDPAAALMWVQFKNGTVYEYSNVGPDVAARMTSGDIGRYFAEIVKPQRYTMPFVKLGVQPLAGAGSGPGSVQPDSTVGSM